MKSSEFETVVVDDRKCMLGEGPVWDEKAYTIFWLDILKGEIHSYSEKEKRAKTLPIGQMIGCMALRKEGGFIAGLESGIYFIDHSTGILEKQISLENQLPENRANDGKCDPSGRFWVGTMSKSEKENAGALYMIRKDLHATMKIPHTTISNGLAWSSDKKYFYFIDSVTRGVDIYDYNDVLGDIENRRRVISFLDKDGFPDGMTIDTEGMLWIAHWGGWQVSRWNPDSGKKLLTIKLPVANVTSCTFGGKSFQDMYITTARKGLTERERNEQPLAGSLFVVRDIGFAGLPAFRFDQ